MTIGVALVGFGQIARQQHVPAILADPAFRLVGVASPDGAPGVDVPVYADAEALLDALDLSIDAVAICTPPKVRHAIASAAIARGKAVLLEKPPAATLGEAEHLAALAKAAKTVLFTAWHSHYAPAVPAMVALIADDPVTALSIEWAENVRQWHPGQDWIWQPGGFGVFDAGINALSIATHLLPVPLLLAAATLYIPANRQAPIAANLAFAGDGFSAAFDWRIEEQQRWVITLTTRKGRQISLSDGGHGLTIDGKALALATGSEYPALYRHFAQLVESGQSAVDLSPLRIVADACLIGQRKAVEPFAWT